MIINDKSETFIKAIVDNKSTNCSTIYYLTGNNGKIKIGHGMCSGAFLFHKGEQFEVSFQLIDQSGNSTLTTEKILFAMPTKPK